jgi:parallel beta-helix repeat protein
MSSVQIPNLPVAIALNGSEQLEAVQAGTSVRVTTNQIASLASLTGNGDSVNVTATGSTTARTLANRFADVVNVKDFGAVGDGVTDDTAAIQAAINAANTAGGGTIIIPKPAIKYLVTSAIVVSAAAPITIIGEGMPEIFSSNSSGGNIFTIGSAPLKQPFIRLQGLYIRGTAGGGSAIRADYIANLVIEGCSIYQAGGNGVVLDNCYTFRLENTQINESGSSGLYLTGASGNGGIVDRCKFYNHSGVGAGGVYIEAAGSSHYGVVIRDSTIEFNTRGIYLTDCDTATIEGCYFEQNVAWAILTPTGAAVRSLNINNNVFFSNGFSVDSIEGLVAEGNTFLAAGNAISVAASSDVRIGPNQFLGGGVIASDDYREFQTWPAWTSYTPAWNASGTAPALGNGTIEARYKRVGNTVALRITLTAGSTTTFGTGVWSFSIPFAAKATSGAKWMGVGAYDDVSAVVAAFNLVAAIDGSSSVAGVFNASGSGVGPTSPITWANGDKLYLTANYECA